MYQEKVVLDLNEIFSLIESCNLHLNGTTELTLGLYDQEKLIATASLQNKIIQMVAVNPQYQDEGLSSRLISSLISYAYYNNIHPLYLFTKPENAAKFHALGFSEVATALPYSSFLEFGKSGIREYLDKLRAVAGELPERASAIVMNCNPFSLGHRYLVEQASKQSSTVFLLVVEEDLSIFPFSDRFSLIKQGVSDLSNVIVIPGGRYIISSLTFPSYFTKESHLAYAHCALDAEIFCRHIAPTLHITKRFVGTEPFSVVTNIYNNTLRDRLPQSGIELIEIPRIEEQGVPISASLIRDLLAKQDMAAVAALVPPTTLAYLRSEKGASIIQKLS